MGDMKREIDLTQQTFFKSRLPQEGPLSGVRSYHSGVFQQESLPEFGILVVEKAERNYFKKKVKTIPVTDITDPDTQVWLTGSPKALSVKLAEPPAGFVQDTEGARIALEKGGFLEEQQRFL